MMPPSEIIVNLGKTSKSDFQYNKKIEYNAQPIAAPNINKSLWLKVKLNQSKISPLIIIIRTPTKQETKPKILSLFIFSPKNKEEIIIIKIGEEV